MCRDAPNREHFCPVSGSTGQGTDGAPDARGPAFADLLARSYTRLMRARLLPEGLRGAEAAEWLYTAPFGLLAQDTSPDPLFVYANLTAQKVFDYGWEEFVGLPSRLSAGEQDRNARDALMQAVARKGHVQKYQGRRMTRDGRHFWIRDTTIWNLTGLDGQPAGQAALIRRWTD